MIAAERKLVIQVDGRALDVKVVIEVPIFDRNAWVSNYSIGWPEGTFRHHATGNDSAQALLSAMRLVAISLYASPHHRDGRLTWERSGDGYGFPLPADSRGLAIGLDKAL